MKSNVKRHFTSRIWSILYSTMYMHIYYFYYAINSLINQNINVIIYMYIILSNIFNNLKFIRIHILLYINIYIYNIIYYQYIYAQYLCINVFLHIFNYYIYNNTNNKFLNWRYIKQRNCQFKFSLNFLYQNMKLRLNFKILTLSIFIAAIVAYMYILYYLLMLIFLLYSFFNLDFFSFKLLVLLLHIFSENIINIIYNIYFNLIVVVLYLNYETVFYLFSEFFWDFTEGAYPLLSFSNRFLNLNFWVANATVMAPQNSFISFDSIALTVYNFYIVITEFFYFYGGLFSFNPQIFLIFDTYVNYKNFIFNNFWVGVLQNVENSAQLLNFNDVGPLDCIRPIWIIFFYMAGANWIGAVAGPILAVFQAPFGIFWISGYGVFLADLVLLFWNFFMYFTFLDFVGELALQGLVVIVCIAASCKWAFLNLWIILLSESCYFLSIVRDFIYAGWLSAGFTFLEAGVVATIRVCEVVLNCSAGCSWSYWVWFGVLKLFYFSAIYSFYWVGILFSKVLIFFGGVFYWIVMVSSAAEGLSILLTGLLSFAEFVVYLLEFFNFFNAFCYFLFDYQYWFSFGYWGWFTVIQSVLSSGFFSIYLVYLSVWVILIGSLVYCSLFLTSTPMSTHFIHHKWPAYLKNLFVLDDYLAGRRVLASLGVGQSDPVLPFYTYDNGRLSLIKLNNLHWFECLWINRGCRVSVFQFTFCLYLACFALIREMFLNVMGVTLYGKVKFDRILVRAGAKNLVDAAVFLFIRKLLMYSASSHWNSVFTPGKWQFPVNGGRAIFSVWVSVLSFSALTALVLENCYWLNEKSAFYLQKGQLTAVSYLNMYTASPFRSNLGYNYVRENIRLAYNTRFLEEFAGSQVRFLGEFYKPKTLLHNYFILNPQDFLISSNTTFFSTKIMNQFGVDQVRGALFNSRLDYFLKFRTLWLFSYLNWFVYQYDAFLLPPVVSFFLPWRVFLQADYLLQLVGVGWIVDLFGGLLGWYRNMFFDFLPFLQDLPALKSFYLDFEFVNLLLWGFRDNNFKFNPRSYYGQWVANPLLSLRWHYAAYLKSRAWYTRRGTLVRELHYFINPYKIFEDINDFPLFYNTLFDDNQLRLDSSFSSNFFYKNFFRSKLLFGYKWNSRDFFDLGLNVFMTPLSKSFYLSSSFADTTFKRQYNSFMSLSNSNRLINRVNGLGVWSASSNVYDMFLRHFYYKYWAAKQAYSHKFLAYDKIQFLKKFRFSRVRAGSVSSLNKSSNLLRFDVYNQDYLNSQLAFFFKTFSVNSDLFFRKFGDKQYFDLSGLSFFSDFRGFKSTLVDFFFDYGGTLVGELLAALIDYCSRVLLAVMSRIFEFFWFFSLPVWVWIPFNLKLQVFNFLNYNAVNLEFLVPVSVRQARNFIFFYTGSYGAHARFLNSAFSYTLGDSFFCGGLGALK